jgi:hypothetical protein
MNADLVFLYEHQIHFHAVERRGSGAAGQWGGGAAGLWGFGGGRCDGRHEVQRGRRR